MMGGASVAVWLTQADSLAIKSLIIFSLGGAVLLVLRRASAAARHLVCLLTLAALLVLPVLSAALPGWRLTVLTPPSSRAGKKLAPQWERALASQPTSARSSPPLPKGEKQEVRPSVPQGPASSSSPMRRAPVNAVNREVGFFALWLLGVLLACLRPLLGLWGIARLSRASVPVTDPAALALAADCARALRLPRVPHLRQANVPVPMTWGWRWPVVLLPAEATSWPEGRLQAVLLHELAHVRRRDWLFHRFADCVCALYWFHPLVWLTARRLRAEGETACDDLVLASGVTATDYARHLLDVARALCPRSAVPQAAIAMARTSRLEGRLKMILDTTRPRCTLSRRVLLLALGVSVAALVLLAVLRPVARAQSAQPPLSTLPAASADTKGVTILFKSLTFNGSNASILLGASSAAARISGKSPRVTSLVFSPDLTVNGTTLLAGVTEADKVDGAWWSGAGIPLPTPVYRTSAYRPWSRPANQAEKFKTKRFAFAFRLPGSLQGATVRYDLPQSKNYSSDGSWSLKVVGRDHLTEAQSNPYTGGARILIAEYPGTTAKANVRVGIATGPWTKAAGQYPTQDRGSSVTTSKGTFIFSPAALENGNLSAMTITTNQPKQDIRVIAVDAQGRATLPSTIGNTMAGGLDQITARFGLPLAQIEEIRVETRPFQWVELKDVALQPAQ